MDGQAIHSLYLSILGQAISGQATHSRTSLTYLDKLCILGQVYQLFGQVMHNRTSCFTRTSYALYYSTIYHILI